MAGMMKSKILDAPIRNQTRVLPACSAVSKPNMLLCTSQAMSVVIRILLSHVPQVVMHLSCFQEGII
jgi:hypothetical protein